ncbi:hypothetical protein BGV68_01900 [Burkholderia ubonensis]|nr:hypothetical protein BGV68_01900 [Burkholderia ubonensis]
MGYSLDVSASSSARSGDAKGQSEFGQTLSFDHSGFVVNFGGSNTNDTRGSSITPRNQFSQPSYDQPSGVADALGLSNPTLTPVLLAGVVLLAVVWAKKH